MLMQKLILNLPNRPLVKYLALLLFLFSTCGLLAQATFEGFESQSPSNIPWFTDTPNNQWNTSITEPYAGTASAISGGFYNNSISNLNLNINVLTAGNISFYFKTDTEYWGAVFGDFLKFNIDGNLQNQWAGTIGWTYVSFPLTAGVHNLSWSFTRDNSDTGWDGWKQNRAWIDNISLPANTYFYGNGDGSMANPYQISTAAQLNSLRNYLGSSYSSTHFKLMNDIDLSSYLAQDGAGYTAWGSAGWMPIGTSSAPFQAHFDGNFKKITGLMINRSSYADCGFFGNTGNTALIENLSIVSAAGSSVQGGNAAGMLVGRNNGTLTNCSATGSVRGTLWNGALVGWNNGTLNRCCSSGDVISTGNTVGGLVGQNNGYINMSYSRAAARGYDYIGGLVGYQTQSGAPGIADCFATGAVTNFGNPSYRGGLLGYLTAGTVSNSYWDTQSTGMSTSYGSASSFGKSTAAMKTQTTYAGWDFAGESSNGTADYWFMSTSYNDAYPYLVWQQTGSTNPVMPHIQVTPTSINFGNRYIDSTSSQTFSITNIGQLPLTGSINTPEYYALAEGSGTRNTLSFNLAAGASQQYILTFAPLAYGTFNGNVVISSNSETESTYYLGVWGVCVPVPETFAGGSGTQADPWLISTPGQLSRLNDFRGAVNSDKYFKIINDIDMTDYFLQGNAGYNYGYYWTPIGSASGGDNKFYGKLDGNHCTISGLKANHLNHTGYESNIGLFGYTGQGFELKNLNLNIDFVAGWNQVGGLIGANSGTVDNCHVRTNGEAEIIGLFGIYCGGLIGINYGTITKCSFRGNVHGTQKVGGLVGAGANIYDSFVTGKVTGYEIVGGFVGVAGTFNGGQIKNCYASVIMEYGSNSSAVVGGFAAQINTVTLTSCYWNRQLANLNTSAGLSNTFGKTTAEMQTTSTYVGWDMVSIWEHFLDTNGGYPQIRLAPATMVFNQQEFSVEVLPGDSYNGILTITNTGAQLLALIATVIYPTRSIQTVLSENFEQGTSMPAGWSQEQLSGSDVSWSFRRGSPGLPNDAHSGFVNANLIDEDSVDDITMLVTPPLNLSAVSYSPQLNFYYYMHALPNAADELKVYYRTSATGTWTLLKNMENVNYWASSTIALPNPSAEYYIGFAGNARAAWGISIDDVVVTGSPAGYADSWLSLNNQQSVNAHVSSRQSAVFEMSLNAANLPLGSYEAVIQLNSNAYNHWDTSIPVMLEVSYGNTPQISISSTGFSFAEQLAGSSANQDFSISNIGGGVLEGTINLPLGYAVSQRSVQRNNLPISIPAGSTQNFSLSFNPSVAGSYDGDLTIFSNSYTDASISLPLSGQCYTNPTILLNVEMLSMRMATGSSGSDTFTITNNGSKPLSFYTTVEDVQRQERQTMKPGTKLLSQRSIIGSSLSLNKTQYMAGTTSDWVFTVHNASTDDEWLKQVIIDFPEGFIINSVSGFVGGTGGTMTPDITSGNGSTVTWTGIGPGMWGVVHMNETAVASVNITIPSGYTVTQSLPYQIIGDIYGAEPHTLTGAFTLEAGSPSAAWFTLDNWDGTVAGNSSMSLTGNFSAEGLLPGVYQALLTVYSNDPQNPVKTVLLELEVTGLAPVLRISIAEGYAFLDWDAVPNASSYKVYKASSMNSTYDLLAETSELYYADEASMDAAFYYIKAVFPRK